LQTGTIVISRNNPTPVIIAHNDKIECISTTSPSIGTSRNIRPSITEFPLESGITIVIYTDGIKFAAIAPVKHSIFAPSSKPCWKKRTCRRRRLPIPFLLKAIRLDNNRPNDDMSVVVLRSTPQKTDNDKAHDLTPASGPMYNHKNRTKKRNEERLLVRLIYGQISTQTTDRDRWRLCIRKDHTQRWIDCACFKCRHIAQNTLMSTMWRQKTNPDILIYLEVLTKYNSTEILNWTRNEYDNNF
jgi:hypothetical protein